MGYIKGGLAGQTRRRFKKQKNKIEVLGMSRLLLTWLLMFGWFRAVRRLILAYCNREGVGINAGIVLFNSLQVISEARMT